jgi:transposase InsO family protein
MERWFGNFKQELPPLSQIEDIAKLHETIALRIHYYNTKRIHLALKMSPAAYAARLLKRPKGLDRMLQKMGA